MIYNNKIYILYQDRKSKYTIFFYLKILLFRVALGSERNLKENKDVLQIPPDRTQT